MLVSPTLGKQELVRLKWPLLGGSFTGSASKQMELGLVKETLTRKTLTSKILTTLASSKRSTLSERICQLFFLFRNEFENNQ